MLCPLKIHQIKLYYYYLKAHSISWKMVQMDLKMDKKWESYSGLNDKRFSANLEKAKLSMALIWEAIWLKKTCMVSYNLKHYMCTNFRPNLRGSCPNFGWSDMEWPVYNMYMYFKQIFCEAFCSKCSILFLKHGHSAFLEVQLKKLSLV